jgi:hypothetical protein
VGLSRLIAAESGAGGGYPETRATSPIEVKERSPFWLPGDWDSFCAQSGCLRAAASRSVLVTAVRSIGKNKVRCFEIFGGALGSPKKIAQATVVTQRDRCWFLHRLVLAPAFAGMWIDVMRSLLLHIGPGLYGYPKLIDDGPCREEDMRGLSEVTIESVHPIVVQSVYFRNWETWDDYFNSLQTNAKRNYKRAIKEIEGLNIVTRRGLRALTELPFLAKCVGNVYRSKGVTHSVPRIAAGFLVKAMLFGDRQFIRVVRSGTRRLAAISGVEFGDRLFYLNGGRGVNQAGAQWYLTIEALRDFRRTHPDGVFVMGHVDYALHDAAINGGLLRFRAACQVTDAPTSVIKFAFSPAANSARRSSGDIRHS